MDDVLVYSPGRSGTTSLGHMLQALGLRPVVTHNLDWQFWIERRRHALGDPVAPSDASSMLYEMDRMRRFEIELRRFGSPSGAKRLIVGIRYPYNHLFSVLAYSAQLQIGWLIRAGLASQHEAGLAIEVDEYRALIERASEIFCHLASADPAFLGGASIDAGYAPPGDGRADLQNFALFYMKYMQTWLRREFQTHLEIDIPTAPRDRCGQGWAVYRRGAAEVLLYALDSPGLDLQAVITEFLDRAPPPRVDNASRDIHEGFHSVVMVMKARLSTTGDLIAAYQADPLIQALYPAGPPDTGRREEVPVS